MEISFSNLSIAASAKDRHGQTSESTPRRTGSMVRPERIRIDSQHPQYHTRKRLNNEDYYRPAGERSAPARRSVIRRGLLGREEEEDRQQQQIEIEDSTNTASNTWDIWKIFCYTVTCCCPPPILKAMGNIYRKSLLFFLVCILMHFYYR